MRKYGNSFQKRFSKKKYQKRIRFTNKIKKEKRKGAKTKLVLKEEDKNVSDCKFRAACDICMNFEKYCICYHCIGCDKFSCYGNYCGKHDCAIIKENGKQCKGKNYNDTKICRFHHYKINKKNDEIKNEGKKIERQMCDVPNVLVEIIAGFLKYGNRFMSDYKEPIDYGKYTYDIFSDTWYVFCDCDYNCDCY